ncbi:amidohydrolase family protein [Chitinophaga pollutisoli]|uniref:Amidohydrolase family protein n=1 Tax=Chitinophaga pollutisoli TaxID=3133966 RepID=A0ABZ2YPR2_9BACT
MKMIDTHLHLWDTARLHYLWLQELPQLQGAFLTEQYRQATAGLEVDRMIFVQCECLPDENLAEMDLVLEQAALDPRIAGMVAYAALEQGAASLQAFTGKPFVKGIRRMYDDSPGICCSPLFLESARAMPLHGLSMDISAQPHALADTARMITQCPDTQFILDHLGKPAIRGKQLEVFKRDMDMLAKFPNLAAKLSGLITEAAWHQWQVEEIAPYIHHAISCFGEDRLMFGGDWPVVLLAGNWAKWVEALREILADYPVAVQEKIWYGNATRFYRLD